MKKLLIIPLALLAIAATPVEAQAPGWVVFTMVTTASCPINADPSFLGYSLQDFPQGNPSSVTITAPDGTAVVCQFGQTMYMVNGQTVALSAPQSADVTVTPPVIPTVQVTDTPVPTDTAQPTDIPTDTPTVVAPAN